MATKKTITSSNTKEEVLQYAQTCPEAVYFSHEDFFEADEATVAAMPRVMLDRYNTSKRIAERAQARSPQDEKVLAGVQVQTSGVDTRRNAAGSKLDLANAVSSDLVSACVRPDEVNEYIERGWRPAKVEDYPSQGFAKASEDGGVIAIKYGQVNDLVVMVKSKAVREQEQADDNRKRVANELAMKRQRAASLEKAGISVTEDDA